jgi:transcriptional regulator GlxA family with amidase domain
MRTRTVGFYVYDGSVLLEFAGPLQVFDVANRVLAKTGTSDRALFQSRLISKVAGHITTREGVTLATHCSIGGHDPLDLVFVPGGALQAQLDDHEVQSWLKRVASGAEVTGSVCVGSFMLGKAGLLDDRQSTTHFDDVGDLAAIAPQTKVVSDRLWVDEGNIITAGGYAAGIDMALHLVERFVGSAMAIETARQLEYRWRRVTDRLLQT